MKKAIDYFKEACEEFESSKALYDEPFFVAAIKRAQIDAIEAAILKCSQDVKVLLLTFDGCTGKFNIDKQSIINIGEQLKKELE